MLIQVDGVEVETQMAGNIWTDAADRPALFRFGPGRFLLVEYPDGGAPTGRWVENKEAREWILASLCPVLTGELLAL